MLITQEILDTEVQIINPGSVFNGMTGVMVESDRPGWVKVKTGAWVIYTLPQFVQ